MKQLTRAEKVLVVAGALYALAGFIMIAIAA